MQLKWKHLCVKIRVQDAADQQRQIVTMVAGLGLFEHLVRSFLLTLFFSLRYVWKCRVEKDTNL